MNKNAQILIGVGVLSAGAYLYWKSTQSTTAAKSTTTTATAANTAAKANADGSIKPLPKDFFEVKSSPNAENNFKNASGVFKEAPTEKVFANASGFEKTPDEKVFANAIGVSSIVDLLKQKPNGFKKTAKSKVFANASGGFEATPPSKVFANMIPTMATHNSGNSFM